jgi:hypothetical protein
LRFDQQVVISCAFRDIVRLHTKFGRASSFASVHALEALVSPLSLRCSLPDIARDTAAAATGEIFK